MIRHSFVQQIKKFYEIINDHNYDTFNVSECIFLGVIFIYHRKIDKIECLHRNIFISVPEFIISFNVYNITECYDHDYTLYIWHYRILLKQAEELAVNRIIKYFRKFLLKKAKNRMDPLKRDLVEYIYHPSRIDFTV